MKQTKLYCVLILVFLMLFSCDVVWQYTIPMGEYDIIRTFFNKL